MKKRRDFQNNKEISFESSALNGLRGFAAIHVLISHSFVHSSWELHFNGHVSYSVDIG
jgi:peptidoglycan/LPS O-acetylase OafA/YrhL